MTENVHQKRFLLPAPENSRFYETLMFTQFNKEPDP